MARPVEYFSCAKCGYRGVAKPDDHTCAPERIVAPPPTTSTLTEEQRSRVYALMAAGDPVERPATARALSNEEHETAARKTALDRFVRETSRLIGRHIEIARDRSWGLAVTQRCQVCREEITKAIPWPGIEKLSLELARAIRHPYLLHTCKPVEQSLFSLTYEELGELWQSVERDATRIAERAVEIEALLSKRKGSVS